MFAFNGKLALLNPRQLTTRTPQADSTTAMILRVWTCTRTSSRAGWPAHNAAVMIVLFLVLGFDLISLEGPRTTDGVNIRTDPD